VYTKCFGRAEERVNNSSRGSQGRFLGGCPGFWRISRFFLSGEVTQVYNGRGSWDGIFQHFTLLPGKLCPECLCPLFWVGSLGEWPGWALKRLVFKFMGPKHFFFKFTKKNTMVLFCFPFKDACVSEEYLHNVTRWLLSGP
jgi:hypothetical protein